jgi:hypothetical protein
MIAALIIAALLLALAATLVAAAHIVNDRDRWATRAWVAEDELERAYRDSGAGS